MHRLLLLSLALLLCFSNSCTKDGTTGPAGAQGPVGPAGENGNTIYSGNGAPASTTGNAGDFYLDLTTGDLYGPKTASGWGTPISLKGAAGANGAIGATGAAGSHIYSGTETPLASLGNVGDYYLDETTYMLYGPKTASGWGSPLSLQGPQGPEGNANVQMDTFTVNNSQWQWDQGEHSVSFQYDNNYDNVDFDTWPARFYVVNNSQFLGNISPSALVHYFFVQTSPTGTIPNLGAFDIASYTFEVVIATGTVIDSMKSAGVNLKDHDAVSRFTGLWLQEKKMRPGNG